MSNLSQFLGGSGSVSNRRIILESLNFLIPGGVTKIRAHAWGGGGSGAVLANTIGGGGYAGGGGGGGYCSYEFSVVPGTTMTIIVGAGGAQVFANIRGSYAGLPGGNTSVTYGSKTITAYGGGGGANTANGFLNIAAFGGAGGKAANGEINIPGGNAHFITFSNFNPNGGTPYILAGGGGAAGTPLYGTPPNASILFANVTARTSNVTFAMGGIGLGGYHVLSNNYIQFGTAQATGGGGTSYIKYDIFNPNIDLDGLPEHGSSVYTVSGVSAASSDYSTLVGSANLLTIYGAGGNGRDSGLAGGAGAPGGGGGGAAGTGSNEYSLGGYSAYFGGGGGAAVDNGSTYSATLAKIAGGGSSGFAGGGGGAVGEKVNASSVISSSQAGPCYGGAGGTGLVILEW